MIRHLLPLAVVVCVGCSNRNYNVANPVVGPPPPRVPSTQVAEVAAESDSEVLPVSYQPSEPLPMTAVVARVNGKPVLAGQLLEQSATRLKQYEAALRKAVSHGQLTEAGYQERLRKAQDDLIKRDLDRLIEQTLMADSVKSKLKKENLEGLETVLDKMFEQEVEDMKAKFQVESTAELEAILQENGLSLETLRNGFGDRALAGEYIKAKMGEDSPVTARELREEYNAHLDEYALPLQIKWQQLQISVAAHGGQAGAVKAMDEAIRQIQSGVDFGEVIKTHSDGPNKINGGHWDWTQPGSIALPEVREALETLQEGEYSPVLATQQFLQIVKVTGRQEAGYKPFEDVQDEIRERLVVERRTRRGEQIIAELRAQAEIETIFDDLEEPATPASR